MKNNYEGLENSLNIETNLVPVKKESVEIVKEIGNLSKSDDLKKDYEYTRANL
jgi:hypothetical protein